MRDAVLLGSSAAAASSAKGTGRSACRTVTSRVDARSTACVPVGGGHGVPVLGLLVLSRRACGRWNIEFYYVELRFHVAIVGFRVRAVKGSRRLHPFRWPSSKGAPMFVNRMPRYEILSEDSMATLDRGWRRIVSEIGSSS